VKRKRMLGRSPEPGRAAESFFGALISESLLPGSDLSSGR